MKRLKLNVLLGLSILMLTVLPVVHAEEDELNSQSDNRKERNSEFKMKREEITEEMKAKRQELKDKITQERCDLLEERISKRITSFEENRDKHITNYNNLLEKLDKIVARLQEEDIDTSSLEEDIIALDELVSDYATSYADFIDQLKIAQGYTCGDSQGAFKDAMQKAHDLLKIAQDKRKAVRAFYIETIRPEIKELREQLAKLRSDDSTHESSEERN